MTYVTYIILQVDFCSTLNQFTDSSKMAIKASTRQSCPLVFLWRKGANMPVAEVASNLKLL